MFNTNELKLIEQSMENSFSSRCNSYEWKELLTKLRGEIFESQVNPFVDANGNRIEEV